MPGATRAVNIGSGRSIQVLDFSDEENEVFERDFPKVCNLPTRYSLDREARHMLSDILLKNKDNFKLIAQAAKYALEPSAGQFGGMHAMQDYGMSLIRPDHVCVAAQGRTFDVALAALTKDNWYGYLHNAAIGGAYNATPLYLRKEVMVGIVGFMELGAIPCAEELQFELSGKALPIYNMVSQMRGCDLPIFELAQPLVIKPAQQYRSAFKTAVVAGNMALMPLGLSFATADFMRTQQPTQPSTTAP